VGKRERGLGKGLDALLPVNEADSLQVVELDIKKVVPQVNQPRKVFAEESLQELADSIREHGVLQPVLVRPVQENYEIIAGERRWRAAEIAGLQAIPAIIKEMPDLQAAEISLVENLQREDLSPIEEAKAYKYLIEQYDYTQELIAARVGKSRAYIANTLRLLNLSDEIIQMIEEKKITAGHARALLAIRNTREQMAAVNEIIKDGLSVRQIEQKVKAKKTKNPERVLKSPEMIDLEERLQRYFGTRTEINRQRKGGKIEIEYYNEEDLERILELIGI
jgi:ParB-like partition proteins